jgi:VanZ family protein
MNTNVSIRIRKLWGPILLMVAISLFSGSAGVQLEGWSFVGIDKLGHLAVFGLLGVAWVRWLLQMGYGQAMVFLLAVVLTTLFGFSDELHQYLNPLRTFEWADLMADFSGAAIASALYLKTPFFKSFLELKIVDFGRLRSSDKIAQSPR